MKKVSKQEYLSFIENYPRRLEVDVCAISDPPIVTYNDFTLADWPKSIVAKTWKYDDDPSGCFYEPEEKREYYIKSNERDETITVDLDSGITIQPGAAYPK